MDASKESAKPFQRSLTRGSSDIEELMGKVSANQLVSQAFCQARASMSAELAVAAGLKGLALYRTRKGDCLELGFGRRSGRLKAL